MAAATLCFSNANFRITNVMYMTSRIIVINISQHESLRKENGVDWKGVDFSNSVRSVVGLCYHWDARVQGCRE